MNNETKKDAKKPLAVEADVVSFADASHLHRHARKQQKLEKVQAAFKAVTLAREKAARKKKRRKTKGKKKK